MTQAQEQNFRNLLSAWNSYQDARTSFSYQELYDTGLVLDRARSKAQLTGQIR